MAGERTYERAAFASVITYRERADAIVAQGKPDLLLSSNYA